VKAPVSIGISTKYIKISSQTTVETIITAIIRVNLCVTWFIGQDLMSSDVFCPQVESQLTMLTGKYNRLVSESEEGMKRMRAMIDRLESEKTGLINQLEEERK